MRNQLAACATAAGRSISEEVEFRLAVSLHEEDRYFVRTANARRAIWDRLIALDWLKDDDAWNPGWEQEAAAKLRQAALAGLMVEVLKLAADDEAVEPSEIATARALVEQIEARNAAHRDTLRDELRKRARRLANELTDKDETEAADFNEFLDGVEAEDAAPLIDRERKRVKRRSTTRPKKSDGEG